MKIRLGFVSNSSSVSYYITIKGPLNEVLNQIHENSHWPWLMPEAIIKLIDKNLKYLNDRLSDIEEKKESFLLIDSKPDLEKKIENLHKDKAKIEEIKQKRKDDKSWNYGTEDLTKIALKLNYIQIDESKPDETVLSSTTMMHNNYIEGMPDLLKDITLYYSFENPSAISLRVDHQE